MMHYALFVWLHRSMVLAPHAPGRIAQFVGALPRPW